MIQLKFSSKFGAIGTLVHLREFGYLGGGTGAPRDRGGLKMVPPNRGTYIMHISTEVIPIRDGNFQM